MDNNAKLVKLMAAIEHHLRIDLILRLASTPLSLKQIMEGYEREALLHHTLVTMDRKGKGL
jgi:hypothetical protein